MLQNTTLVQLETLWREGAAHDAALFGGAGGWQMLAFDAGKFIYQLARAAGARRIVEIGTGSAYSTLWLALAAQHNQGKVTSLDCAADFHSLAQSRLDAFGLGHVVTLEIAEAGAWLSALEAGPVDFLFLDADPLVYPALWPQIQRVLRPGGLLVMNAARVLDDESALFSQQVLATNGYLAETYPIGNGLFVILKDE